MTFVLGVKCSNGIAVVSDRLFTDAEAKKSYGPKIERVGTILCAFSYSRDHFSGFKRYLDQAMTEEWDRAKKDDRKGYLFTSDRESVLRESRNAMLEKYHSNTVNRSQLLFAFKDSAGTHLYFSPNASIVTARENYAVLGDMDNYVAPFLSAISPTTTTDEALLLGFFCVKLLASTTNLVGMDRQGENKYPQAWVLPSDPDNIGYEIGPKTVLELDARADQRLRDFQHFVGCFSGRPLGPEERLAGWRPDKENGAGVESEESEERQEGETAGSQIVALQAEVLQVARALGVISVREPIHRLNGQYRALLLFRVERLKQEGARLGFEWTRDLEDIYSAPATSGTLTELARLLVEWSHSGPDPKRPV